MVSYSIYTYLVLDFLNPLAVDQISWGIAAEPAVSGTIAFIVHLFLTHRIYKMNEKLAALAIVLVLTSMFSYALSFYSVYLDAGADRVHVWETASAKNFWVSIAALCSTTAVDIVITVAICLLLYKNRTGVRSADKVISMLTAYTVSSGLLPTLVSVGLLVAAVAYPEDMVNEAFNMIVSKAYANAFLATLNGRQTISDRTHNSTIQWLSRSTGNGSDTISSGNKCHGPVDDGAPDVYELTPIAQPKEDFPPSTSGHRLSSGLVFTRDTDAYSKIERGVTQRP